MRRRELRTVDTETRLGSVGISDDGKPFFVGQAKNLFAYARRTQGEESLIKELLDDGWSNGYLYLAEEKGKSNVRM